MFSTLSAVAAPMGQREEGGGSIAPLSSRARYRIASLYCIALLHRTAPLSSRSRRIVCFRRCGSEFSHCSRRRIALRVAPLSHCSRYRIVFTVTLLLLVLSLVLVRIPRFAVDVAVVVSPLCRSRSFATDRAKQAKRARRRPVRKRDDY